MLVLISKYLILLCFSFHNLNRFLIELIDPGSFVDVRSSSSSKAYNISFFISLFHYLKFLGALVNTLAYHLIYSLSFISTNQLYHLFKLTWNFDLVSFFLVAVVVVLFLFCFLIYLLSQVCIYWFFHSCLINTNIYRLC